MEKNYCWINYYKIHYKINYPELDSHIKDKIRVVLNFSNYAKKN